LRFERQLIASIETARVVSNEASQLIAAYPAFDWAGLAAAIGEILAAQTDLYTSFKRLVATLPASRSDEDLRAEGEGKGEHRNGTCQAF
jgi:hypothetical protein